MIQFESKNGLVKIYAETIEEQAVQQIKQIADSPIGQNANIRIMPDAHSGAGCCIGTTMHIVDKVCPNVVGVDIGCGVTLAKTNVRFQDNLERLDKVIRYYIPSGKNVHENITISPQFFGSMHCWGFLDFETRKKAMHSCGTLGGGNHFIEVYEGGYIAVHSGSRNIGLRVANYYQNLAENACKKRQEEEFKKGLEQTEPRMRGVYVANYKKKIFDNSLAYLEGEDLTNYINDSKIICEFASINRFRILDTIVSQMGGYINKENVIESVHNYIANDRIIRKGAIAAYAGETCVIPLNMRDGVLICKGKGNSDWNYSAPHGAGRLYSRKEAKQRFTMKEFRDSMQNVYTTCINPDTLDEAPFAYKDAQEIIKTIEPTVSIIKRLAPLYNFKAAD